VDIKDFNKGLGKINESLSLDFVGVENKGRVFIIPLNKTVSMDREGLVEVWGDIKKMEKAGIDFEKVRLK